MMRPITTITKRTEKKYVESTLMNSILLFQVCSSSRSFKKGAIFGSKIKIFIVFPYLLSTLTRWDFWHQYCDEICYLVCNLWFELLISWILNLKWLDFAYRALLWWESFLGNKFDRLLAAATLWNLGNGSPSWLTNWFCKFLPGIWRHYLRFYCCRARCQSCW